MQFSRPHDLGATATQNGGYAVYDGVFTHVIADTNGGTQILQGHIVAYQTSPTAGVGLLGHSVTTIASADSPLVAGIAEQDAADGESLLVQISGVADVIVLAAITVAGEAIATSGTAGQATDSGLTDLNATGELVAAVAGVSLEGRGSDGKALCRITCG